MQKLRRPEKGAIPHAKPVSKTPDSRAQNDQNAPHTQCRNRITNDTTKASLAAAEQKVAMMRDVSARHTAVHLGMPDFRTSAGRLTPRPVQRLKLCRIS
ncbi:hypothetical protein ABT390_38555 [Streptomyces aurantiacus]|uniref:hypothetical protein n=1 Tax=Streptomyces aurantiacus TaxID=47760 RepID=UPI000996DCA6|nr:hypothetical protein [Streptomyces aurantiacus]